MLATFPAFIYGFLLCTYPLCLAVADVEGHFTLVHRALDFNVVPRRLMHPLAQQMALGHEKLREVSGRVIVHDIRRLATDPLRQVRKAVVGRSVLSDCALPVVPTKGREAWVQTGKKNKYRGITGVRSPNPNDVKRYIIYGYCTYEELPGRPNLDMVALHRRYVLRRRCASEDIAVL